MTTKVRKKPAAEKRPIIIQWTERVRTDLTDQWPDLRLNLETDAGLLTGTYKPRDMPFHVFNAIGIGLQITPKQIEEFANEHGLSYDTARERLIPQVYNEVNLAWSKAIELFSDQFKEKMESALCELSNRVVMEALSELGLIEGTKAENLNALDRLLRKERNKSIGIGPGGSKPLYDLAGIKDHYDQLLPIWKDAKTVYKNNRKDPRWMEFVKARYPDLPNDLVARLEKHPRLSEDLLTMIDRQGGTSAPFSIAYEHAARMCGAEQYVYHQRTLQGYVSVQRKTDENQNATLSFTDNGRFGENEK